MILLLHLILRSPPSPRLRRASRPVRRSPQGEGGRRGGEQGFGKTKPTEKSQRLRAPTRTHRQLPPILRSPPSPRLRRASRPVCRSPQGEGGRWAASSDLAKQSQRRNANEFSHPNGPPRNKSHASAD